MDIKSRKFEEIEVTDIQVTWPHKVADMTVVPPSSYETNESENTITIHHISKELKEIGKTVLWLMSAYGYSVTKRMQKYLVEPVAAPGTMLAFDSSGNPVDQPLEGDSNESSREDPA